MISKSSDNVLFYIFNYMLEFDRTFVDRKKKSARDFHSLMRDVAHTPVIQEMKQYNHHSNTSCFTHSVHVAYYNYIICKKLGWDYRAAAKGGMLHDLFLYDWHTRDVQEGERLHGFEHPSKALKNAGKHFDLTRKEGDIIVKHMFPLTLTLPMYRESYVTVMTDKFCSVCEVMDRFFKRRNMI